MSVGVSVCPVDCGKTADQIRMPFGIISRTGPRMRQGRGIAVLNGGPRHARGKGRFWVFVLHFRKGKCHTVANGEMFPIHMRELDNVSVRQMYHWKDRFVGFLAIDIFSFKIKVRVYEKLTKTY